MTALYIGFAGSRKLGKREKEELYISLDSIPEEKNTGYILEFLSETSFEKRSKKGELWFKCKDILKLKPQEIYKLYRDNDTASDIVHRLHELTTSDCLSVPSYEFSLNDAVEVFSRINSGGKPLEKTDLLMSFIAAKFKDLDIKEKIQEFVQNLADIGFEQFGCDSFLTACMVFANHKTKFSVSDFTADTINKIEENWDKITASINKTIKKLENNGYAKSKISTNIVISLAFAEYKGLLKKADKSNILDFICRAQFTSFFDSRTDTQLKKIIDVLEESADFVSALERLKKQDFQVSVQDIEDIVENTDYKKSDISYTVLRLLFATNNITKDIDHIYPESQFYNKTHTRKKDKLFNLQFLSCAENRGEKKDLEPQQWLDKTYSKQEQRKFREDHLLPDIPLTWENIDKFEKERKKLLIQELKEKLGLN